MPHKSKIPLGEKIAAVEASEKKGIVALACGKRNDNLLVFDTFDLVIAKYPDVHQLFHSDRDFQVRQEVA